jgi:prevent-host-death family protein
MDIPSGEFIKRLGEILEMVSKGEEVLLTRYGRPYVRLLPAEPPPATGGQDHPKG